MTPEEFTAWATVAAWVVAFIPWILIIRRERKDNRKD